MVTKEDIEGWLNRIAADGATHSEVEPGLWIVVNPAINVAYALPAIDSIDSTGVS